METINNPKSIKVVSDANVRSQSESAGTMTASQFKQVFQARIRGC